MIKNLNFVLYITIICIIASINKLSDKKKFMLKILTGSSFNKFLIILFILFMILEDYVLGMLMIVLFYIIYIETNTKNRNIYEGFLGYFDNNN